MKAAYADPPYLGCGKSHYGALHEQAADYDDPEHHRRLIERLCDEFHDIFPGSGAVGEAWAKWSGQRDASEQLELAMEAA